MGFLTCFESNWSNGCLFLHFWAQMGQMIAFGRHVLAQMGEMGQMVAYFYTSGLNWSKLVKFLRFLDTFWLK